MERLNLTLDADTARVLSQHAREHGRPRAALARELIREALDRRVERERRLQLARDYAAGRQDAAEILADLERGQLELIESDDE